MELTIDQALQKGVAAHKAGKLEHAEGLYRAILNSQPNHPDANHNLGVLAVSVNKTEAALLLFKAALEANPKIEQFWLSYIHALIKEQRLENAKQVLEQAKRQGVRGEKLNNLEIQLTSLSKGKNVDSLIPSQKQLNSLSESFQKGRLDEAEKHAISITEQFPKHQFAWKVLGVIFGQTGRKIEAVNFNQVAVELSPQDAEAHSNLGITLQELGKLDEAEVNYRQAIALKPDLAQAYSNLGITLQELGKLNEAEVTYRQAIALKSDLAQAHTNLGVTLQKQGRIEEAEASHKRAIALRSDYAEAHYNLGVTLQELGKLEKAKASYTYAIELKADYPEAHSNLGITLHEMGRSEEAEASHIQAITLKPDLAQAHSNLGITLQKLGRLKEAKASYIRAIVLRLEFAEAHSNLGITLQELGRLEEAEASHKRAITLKPSDVDAQFNLSDNYSYLNDLEKEICAWKNLMYINANDYGLRAGINLAICNFLQGDFKESKRQVRAAERIQEKTLPKFENEKVYQRYLLNILKWHEDKYLGVDKEKNAKVLYVVGESHSLASHNLGIQYSGNNFVCKARLIKGCKQWHLGNACKNHFKSQFERVFCSLPKSSEVLLTIGEIDCRLNTGIMKHKNKFPEKEIEEIIVNTIELYLTYILTINSDYQHNIIIQGVPCPNIDTGIFSKQEITQLIEVIKNFNRELENNSKKKGLDFLDVHKPTDRGDGFSNAIWHIDQIHLSPEGFLEAWRRYVSD